MEAHVLTQSYDRHGGHSSISIIGDLLEQAAKGSECGVAVFEATVCFRTAARPKPTLEELYSRFHTELDDLPRFRWERAKGRFSVRYESHLGTADGVLQFGPPSRALLQSAVVELAGLLSAHEGSLRRKAGLPLTAFLELVRSLQGMIPGTDAALDVLRQELSERRRAERSALPWWEQVGIDWSDYHPRAKEILDAPYFWSQVDDDAPHGNDTGADLLPAFRKWRRSHRTSPALEFLDGMLRGWGFSISWKDRPVQEWEADVETALDVYCQAAVALAFALIKLEGACPEAPRAAALEAIDLQLDGEVAARFGWTVPRERVEALGKLRAALQRAP